MASKYTPDNLVRAELTESTRKFNMPRPQVDDDCHCLSFEQVNDRIQLPDIATQDHLITLFFTYVHHYFPVVHKASFLSAYYER